MSKQDLKKILYAEDEDDIRTITHIALEDVGGFTVTYCTDGQDALSKAMEIKPDLLLLDVMMPKMDGPSLLKELRKLPDYENIPAIFITSRILPDEIAEYKKMGAIEVITKPFDPMTLVDEIKKAWSKS